MLTNPLETGDAIAQHDSSVQSLADVSVRAAVRPVNEEPRSPSERQGGRVGAQNNKRSQRCRLAVR